jgi:hypothetical protein
LAGDAETLSLEHRKYQRVEAVKKDKNQLMFTTLGSLKLNPNIVVISHDTLLPLTKQVSCPFCLGLSEFRLFLVSNKQGISRSMGKCPLCGQGMFLKSLSMMDKTNAAGYAKWAFNYKGFFHKINFNQWKGRLQLMGWTSDFWEAYHALKGEQQEQGDESESFMDYVNRKGQEAAEEWNKEDQAEASKRAEIGEVS